MAAENAAFPGGKVGGIGDVIAELPPALVAAGCTATVLTPSYGVFHQQTGARRLDAISTWFRGKKLAVSSYEMPQSSAGIQYIVFDHVNFVPDEAGTIYHISRGQDDPPFRTDADKFAFFCATVAAWLETLPHPPDALHLHDWHTGCLAALRKFGCGYKMLRNTPLFFTIHNLSYQGQRPMRGDSSSFQSWFPELDIEPEKICDPADIDVFNPMAAAIRLSDRINTVSATYAEEIQRPSIPAAGFIGGEGLETLLQEAGREQRLVGILNGCNYGSNDNSTGWPDLRVLLQQTVAHWLQRDPESWVHLLAQSRIAALPEPRPQLLYTSVGRLVAQKSRLFLEPVPGGKTALECILEHIGDGSLLLILGSGEPGYERHFADLAEGNANLLFLNGYSDRLAKALYSKGDLFLMPSSFEPCGISQMLAMAAGQPSVVHGVGGLADTVTDGQTGFVFHGDSPGEQAGNFVSSVIRATRLQRDNPLRWEQIAAAAAAQRFDWPSAASQYLCKLYAWP